MVLGFLDLQVGKAAGSFYHNLEDHLTTVTKLTGDITAHAPTHSGPAYLQGLLEQTVECMGQLQSIMNRNEDNRSNVLQSLHVVGEKMSMLTEQMVSQQVLLKKMAQGHVDLQKQLENLTTLTSTPAFQGKDDGIKQ